MKQTILFTLFATFSFSVANAQVPSYVPTDGLVGWWPFNGDAADESGNGNDGTVNGATLTTDRNGNLNNAFFFNGSSSTYIDCGSDMSLQVQNELTFSIWFTMNGGFLNPRLLSYETSNCPGYGIATAGTNPDSRMLGAAFYNQSGQGCGFENIPVTGSGWHHVVLSVDENGFGRFYLDGILESSNQGTPISNNLNYCSSLNFGRLSHPSFDAWGGNLDDIGIWNRALTEEEIQLLFNGCTVTPTAIVGENAPLNFTTSTYFCNDNPGSSYTWTVTNGVISSGQGTNSIIVLWGNEGEGTVSVIETNAEGCDGPVASFIVDVQCSSNITSIDGNITPVILSPIAYTVNGPADSEYAWSVTNGVIVSGQGTNSVNVIWAAEGEGTLSVIETTSTGCESPVVTITTNATLTSVIEQEEKRISIYPNPVSQNMTIDCPSDCIGKNYFIYDALGRKVIQGIILSTRMDVDVQQLTNGDYMFQCENVLIKLIKQ